MNKINWLLSRRRAGTLLFGLALTLPACAREKPKPTPQARSAARPTTQRQAASAAARAPDPAYSDASYTRHIKQVKKQLGPGFTIVKAHPFVVAGDEPAAAVQRHAKYTVDWATQRLKALYFDKDPARILTIYLFKNRHSYERHTKRLFGHAPSTPFGFYSDTSGALVMNIATGGGTLVHEMVHPFVEANFPACPAWFNEGLGSLYEQCREKNSRIWGLTNWRLAGLQRAIQAGRLPSFKKLTHTTTRQFYNEDSGTNYAQARYLCLYLQEQGKLARFYKAFVKNARTDPSGYKTLQKVLGEPDMTAFQQRWEKWVLGLRFP